MGVSVSVGMLVWEFVRASVCECVLVFVSVC